MHKNFVTSIPTRLKNDSKNRDGPTEKNKDGTKQHRNNRDQMSQTFRKNVKRVSQSTQTESKVVINWKKHVKNGCELRELMGEKIFVKSANKVTIFETAELHGPINDNNPINATDFMYLYVLNQIKDVVLEAGVEYGIDIYEKLNTGDYVRQRENIDMGKIEQQTMTLINHFHEEVKRLVPQYVINAFEYYVPKRQEIINVDAQKNVITNGKNQEDELMKTEKLISLSEESENKSVSLVGSSGEESTVTKSEESDNTNIIPPSSNSSIILQASDYNESDSSGNTCNPVEADTPKDIDKGSSEDCREHDALVQEINDIVENLSEEILAIPPIVVNINKDNSPSSTKKRSISSESANDFENSAKKIILSKDTTESEDSGHEKVELEAVAATSTIKSPEISPEPKNLTGTSSEETEESYCPSSAISNTTEPSLQEETANNSQDSPKKPQVSDSSSPITSQIPSQSTLEESEIVSQKSDQSPKLSLRNSSEESMFMSLDCGNATSTPISTQQNLKDYVLSDINPSQILPVAMTIPMEQDLLGALESGFNFENDKSAFEESD